MAYGPFCHRWQSDQRKRTLQNCVIHVNKSLNEILPLNARCGNKDVKKENQIPTSVYILHESQVLR
ncbi:hypothetical protein CHS0354_013746 [Potamilus streckersoni]|uniref:Uncharacterized protein n=1 Tax=Potamilus streckersoni TaxID=2493646 RepID=A0AAE0SH25_9BIVA|nr:hypothetical protein CHS0354_013746 [Potamilus streckersoni]